MFKTKLSVAIGLLATAPIIFAAEEAPVEYTEEPAAASTAVGDDDGSYWGFTPSATVTFTNDYIWRGVSQTSNGPAIQGSFDVSHELGFYAGAWASNVEFDDASANSMELDLYGGFSRETDFGGLLPFSFAYDIGWLSYVYPQDSDNLNFNEVYFGLSFAPVNDFNFSTYWYQDVGVENKFAHGYLDISADYTLPDWAWGITMLGHAGRYYKGSYGDSYWDWKLGIAKQVAGFGVELAYTETDGAGFDGLDDARFVVSVSRSLGDPIRSAPLPDGFTASASVALTSDYIWRGVSQTSNGLAIQGSFDLAHDLGFYAGVWGSNVEFDDFSSNSLELDIYGGFSRETDFGGMLPFSFTYDVGWLSYIYPLDSDNLNFSELYFGLGISPIENFNLSTYWYEDIGIENKFGQGYLDMSADYTVLPDSVWSFTAVAHGGRYFKGSRGKSYWDWKAGLAKDVGPFNVEIAYTDTDGADADGLDDARGVATISTSF